MAESNRDLALRTFQQPQDRFAAGIATSVVQSQANQHCAVDDVVVCHVVNIEVRSEQLGTVFEITRTTSDAGSAERLDGMQAKSFP